MGFFDFIGDCCSAICDFGRSVYKGVKEFFGFGDDEAEETGRRRRYDRDTASIEETLKVNNSLSSLKNKAGEMAVEQENQFCEIGEKIFNGLVDEIYRINERCGLKLPVNEIRHKSQATIRSIRGTISRDINPKLSIDNSDCLEILKMNEGSDKAEAMKKFIRKSMKESYKSLKDKINDSIEGDIIGTKERLEDKFQSYKSLSDRDLKTLNSFKQNEGKDNAEREKVQFGVAFELFLSSKGLSLLKEKQI